jgi:hypothetical protein
MASRAGSPNKNKQALLKMLELRYPDYHPVIELVEIAMDKENDVSLRLNANKEVAQYVVPKLRAVEHTGKDGGAIETKWTTEVVRADSSDS